MDADAQGEPLDAQLEAQWRTVRVRIEANRHLLVEHGALVLRGGKDCTCWRLRFYERTQEGRVVQRSIQVGDNQELVRRARELLASYRQPGELARETAELVRLALAMAGVLVQSGRNH
jgi:hypothetical protein